jgi:putative endonuclease
VRQFHVYLLASRSRVLYVGVTSRLKIRVWQHREKLADGFTKRYAVNRLVWFEEAGSALGAIQREKQIKGWTRRKKVALIQERNARWRDLYHEI